MREFIINIAKPILEFMVYNLKIIDRLEIEYHKKYYNKKYIMESAKLANLKVEKYQYFQLGCNNFAILKNNRNNNEALFIKQYK